jgi:hypothetical protein
MASCTRAREGLRSRLIELCASDPSPNAKKWFDTHFGQGAGDRALAQ